MPRPVLPEPVMPTITPWVVRSSGSTQHRLAGALVRRRVDRLAEEELPGRHVDHGPDRRCSPSQDCGGSGARALTVVPPQHDHGPGCPAGDRAVLPLVSVMRCRSWSCWPGSDRSAEGVLGWWLTGERMFDTVKVFPFGTEVRSPTT